MTKQCLSHWIMEAVDISYSSKRLQTLARPTSHSTKFVLHQTGPYITSPPENHDQDTQTEETSMHALDHRSTNDMTHLIPISAEVKEKLSGFRSL